MTTAAEATSTPADAGQAHSVTIAWVGDTVLASNYGMPPDGGRRSMAPVVGPLRSADLAFGNLEETLSAPPRVEVRQLAELLRVPGPAVLWRG